MGAVPVFRKVTLCGGVVLPVTVASKLIAAGANAAAAAGVSAGTVHGADGPPTTPEPFSKMVDSVKASGMRPSHSMRDSAPMKNTRVVVVPSTARTISGALRHV